MKTFYHLLWGNANNCLFPLQWECDRGGFTTALLKFWRYSESVQVFPVRTHCILFLSQFFLRSRSSVWPSLIYLFFIIISRDRKMALLQMSTVEEAIQTLIDLHNYDMGRGHRLRVSFSKSTIWGSPGAVPPFLSLSQEPHVEFIFTSHSLTPYQELQWEWPLKEHSLCICSYYCLCMASCYSVLGWIDKNVPYLAK